MKLVTYNIRYGLGLDQSMDLGRIARTVRDADIVALQEVERFWKRSAMSDQPEILATHLKEFHWVYFPAFDVSASEGKEDGSVLNRRRQFGPMVLSRWPILSSRSIMLPKLGTLDRFNMNTGALECVIDTPSGYLRVYSVHLSAASRRERLMQVDRLLEVHRNTHVNGGAWTGGDAIADPAKARRFADQNWANDESLPPMPKEAIAMGDFNAEPDSEEYDKMVGAEDPCYGRVGHLDGFVDSWLVAKARSGDDRTTWFPDPPERAPGRGLKLDHCFVAPDLARNVGRAWVDRDADGSDHKPYWVELDLVPRR